MGLYRLLESSFLGIARSIVALLAIEFPFIIVFHSHVVYFVLKVACLGSKEEESM